MTSSSWGRGEGNSGNRGKASKYREVEVKADSSVLEKVLGLEGEWGLAKKELK